MIKDIIRHCLWILLAHHQIHYDAETSGLTGLLQGLLLKLLD